MLAARPGFTAIAIITLALGIGANTTIFSFVDTLFYRPLPVSDPYQLVNVYSNEKGVGYGNFSYPEYVYLRDHNKSFQALAAHYSYAPLQMVADGSSKEEQGAVVSSNYFSVLGVTPLRGRFFLPDEDAVPDRNPVAVISFSLWQRRFNGEPGILGKVVRINGTDFQVIGIAREDFTGVRVGVPNDVWIPSMMLKVGYRWCDGFKIDCATLGIIGRLAPGHKLADARGEMGALAGQLELAYPENNKDHGTTLVSAVGIDPRQRNDFVDQMRLLMTVASLLLVIGCINVAGLLLARGTARRKEIAMRLSLGASRSRVIRQLLTESLLLAVLGGGVGFLMSIWAKNLLFSNFYSIDTEGYRGFYDLSIDWRVPLYSLGLSSLTGVLFGVMPAIKATRYDLASILKESGGSQSPRSRLRSALVAAQIALSLALVMSAGLLVRSSATVRRGANFDAYHVALMRLRPRMIQYSPEKAQGFTREVVRRLQLLPGVQSVSLAKGIGLAWMGNIQIPVRRPDQTSNRAEDNFQVFYHEIAPRFFETLKIPLITGRDFNDSDRPGSPPVTIVNETLARQMWPEGSALGRTLIVADRPFQVVGLFKDARLHAENEAAMPFLYVPYWQNQFDPQIDSRLVIRVAGDPSAMIPQLRREVMAVDPDVPIAEDMPMTEQVNGAYRPVLMASSVLVCSGIIALFLTAIGLYGVLAFMVSQRTREIGIRMALGAQTTDVLRLVVKQGMTLVVIGIAAGLVAAFVFAHLISNILYGVSSTDPMTAVIAIALIVFVAFAACFIPARWAGKVDPMVALRYE